MSNGTRSGPVIFGEVLFDHFADGSEVLGGAPFNVAWHLRGFGLDPLFVGRIGVDEPGECVRERMMDWDLETSALQDDLVHGTGVVRASIERGVPRYDIVAGRAWDFVDADHALASARLREVTMLYHGTLAARQERSRRALERLRDALEAPVFCDVNLREPWTPLERAHELLAGAHVAKLNDEELTALTTMPCTSAADCVEAAGVLRARHGLQLVVVTRGEHGAIAVHAGGHEEVTATAAERVIDTVGAGDAFAAVLMIGSSCSWPLSVTLDRASRFAASICSIRGATTDDPRLYRFHRAEWTSEEERRDAS